MAENNDPSKRHFRCEHCNGLIVIPADLPPTKGPCPHCAKTIQSPGPEDVVGRPPPPDSLTPLPPPGGRQGGPVQPVAPPAPVLPVPSAPVVPIVTVVPERAVTRGEAAEGEVSEKTITRSPETGEGGGAPASAPIVARLQPPEPERMSGSVAGEEEVKKTSRRGVALAVVIAILLVLGALVAAVLVAPDFLGVISGGDDVADDQREDEIRQARYLRTGWKDEATETLARFLAARTVAERARYSIGGASLAAEMEGFYGGAVLDDSDTPVEAFSAYDLRLEDRERGLFLMVYDQPPQFELGEFFRPLATLEVQHQVEPPDMLLASFARVGNFVMEPVRVQAFFLKTEEGMKVDWHVFTQTKHRLMSKFLFVPEPGRTAVFRVMVGEDVPEAGRVESGMRTYRVGDPVHRSDAARIPVTVDSEVGRVLSAVNWLGSDGVAEMRTATLELGWEDVDDPKLVIRRFLCWEFLGLGGEAATSPGEGGG